MLRILDKTVCRTVIVLITNVESSKLIDCNTIRLLKERNVRRTVHATNAVAGKGGDLAISDHSNTMVIEINNIDGSIFISSDTDR